MKTVQGPIVAIVVPFDEKLRVDRAALEDYLQFLSETGVKSIVVNGTTGEFPSLTARERLHVYECSRSIFPGPILLNVSSPCAAECRTYAETLAGTDDGLLLLPPYYYAGAPAKGVTDFMRSVVSQTEQEVYLYNFPAHTGNGIDPEELKIFSGEFANIRGIKDSSGSLESAKSFAEACDGVADFKVFVGSDSLALKVLEAGLAGSVTGAANPVPEFLIEMARAFQEKRTGDASYFQERLNAWTALRKELDLPEIPVVKAALGARVSGFPPFVRPPFSTISNTAPVVDGTRRILEEKD